MRFTKGLISLIGGMVIALPGYAAQDTVAVPAMAAVEQGQNRAFVDALQAAYINNPSLRSARAELRAVQEQLPQALSGWMPSVAAETSIQSNNISAHPASAVSGTTEKRIGVSLNQPLFRGGRTSAETRAARHTIKSQIATLIAREQSILLQTVTAYMDVVQHRALLELSQNNRKVIARQQEATTDRFEVGELSKTDVQQAAARLAGADAQVITANGALRNSEAIFEQLVGFAPKGLGTPDIALTLPLSLDESMQEAERHNPDVIASISAQRAAEEDTQGVFATLLPQVALSASVNKSFDPSSGLADRQTNKAIGISASIPLFSAGNTRSRVRQAKHVANQRFLDIRNTKRAARQLATKSWEDLLTARAEIKARKAQAESSAIAREGVEAEAAFGSRTVLDTLDADQELLDAQVALVTAERNKIVAEFSLLSVLGRLTPEQLGFSDKARVYESDLNSFKWDILKMDVDRVTE